MYELPTVLVSDSLTIHTGRIRVLGHGTKLRDDDTDEDDGYDEALVPLDFQESDMIRDDDLYDILIKPLASGVHVFSLVR